MVAQMPRNQVRIIGGFWKGRKLSFPRRDDLRPTLARVRETLFSWLAPTIAGADCLDLFAGSGALGFEALSRGAGSLTLVEADRQVAQALRENGARLGARRLLVRRQAALSFLRQAVGKGISLGGKRLAGWNCVFLDPPFSSAQLPRVLALLAGGGLLRPDGLVYFETSAGAALNLSGWTTVRDGKVGANRFGLLRRILA